MKILFWLLGFWGATALGLGGSDSFSATAWQEIAPIYKAITEHPFNQALAEGTLEKPIFAYYSAQDSLYLSEFAKVLGIFASKLDKPEDIRRVFQSVTDCLLEEKAAHLPSRVASAPEMEPATFNYINFLLVTAAYKSREELAAALLPCFWIYMRLARDMQQKAGKKASPKNFCGKWIETYASAKYQASVEYMIKLTDDLAARASKEQRVKMLTAFVTASRLEWYFWEAAYYRMEWKP